MLGFEDVVAAFDAGEVAGQEAQGVDAGDGGIGVVDAGRDGTQGDVDDFLE